MLINMQINTPLGSSQKMQFGNGISFIVIFATEAAIDNFLDADSERVGELSILPGCSKNLLLIPSICLESFLN